MPIKYLIIIACYFILNAGSIAVLATISHIPSQPSQELGHNHNQDIHIYEESHLFPAFSAEEPLPKEPDILKVSVQKGDTFLSILQNLSIDTQEAIQAIDTLSSLYDPKKLKLGQGIEIAFFIGSAPEHIISLESIEIQKDYKTNIRLSRLPNDTFHVAEHELPLETRVVGINGTISHSLAQTASLYDISNSALYEMIAAYSYDVDFQRDLRKGDSFDILLERYYNDEGKHVADGKILYASLILSGNSLPIYRFNYDGAEDFFDPLGRHIKKPLLRTPVNGARISSTYGKRHHPVLGYTKMHKGIDFAAPRGTPIYAAGNGRIEKIGRHGSFGKYVRIRHNSEHSTAYAHIHRFAKGLKKGSRVKQGQIIAYVGSTGRATGPHLHYEVIKNGKQMNPLKVKFAPTESLKGEQLAAFHQHKATLDSLIAEVPHETQIALK